MPDASPRGEMPFLEHLEELRWRILWSLLAIAAGTAIGWLLVDRIDVITLLRRPIAPFLPDGRLSFTSPTEPFLLTLKVSFAVGCLLASPVVIYQIWAFLAPALYEREKRLIVPALAVGVVLFLAGAVAAYLWALPAALNVLFGFTREDLAPVITIDRYFGFAIPFILAFGIITELPLVVAILASLGLVTPQFLARHRRYAIVVAAVVAALLTPPDALSMLMMLVPLLLLYEISIWCAWIATRRRARRQAAAVAASGSSAGPAAGPGGSGGGGGGGAGAAAVLLGLLVAGPVAAQQPVPPPKPPPAGPDTAAAAQAVRAGRSVDTAAARKLGLPTGPERSFPATDPVIDSLLKLQGFRVTRYVADTLTMLGESQTIVLRGEAFVEREGTQIEADSIRYHEASCRLDAEGSPRLFDEGTVLVGNGMRYDTCVRRGTVRDALTNFEQGGVIWITRGRQLTADSASRRVYGREADITSDQQPVPDYHFAVGRVKWINKNTMVARPVVLYVRDVPVMWLPFIFNDIRSGRRSGILVPRFGLNDLVRTSRSSGRQVTGFGYYFAINDYLDLTVSGDWYAGRSLAYRAQGRYRWLDRFVSGGFSYMRTQELDLGGNASAIHWDHSQTFSSKTRFNANVDYSTSAFVVARNSLDPFQVTATLGSSLNFSKQFPWGTLTLGGSRRQELSNDRVTQSFPTITLAPLIVNITPSISWSPAFTFQNDQVFHDPTAGTLLVPGASQPVDTLPLFSTGRTTSMSVQTPLRVGRWTWGNGVSIRDEVSNRRAEFLIPDSTVPGGVRRVLYARTFETAVDWQTSINLPPLFTGTWKLQPGIAIVNTTSGPFMVRNQFSRGEFVRQGKRLSFNASLSPTFFAFFPGVGPLARIRHSISPGLSYQYAPGVRVPEEYARVVDPTGTRLDSRIDPQQTITLSLSQNFEAKFRPAPGDTGEGRKVRLLAINTSGIGYNFEQAKQPGRTGWQTSSLTNTITSDLVRGFSVTLTHELWDGQVGLDTTRFDPFLQTISLSPFTITPGTIRGLAGLFGLGGRPPASPAPTTPGADSIPPGGTHPGGTTFGSGFDPGNPYGASTSGGTPRGGGFSLTVGYSSSRSRGDTLASSRRQPGRRVARLDLAFSPTRRWTARWSTAYDLGTRQFADHFVSFERDLNRWRASFVMSKGATGNFSFSFNISLTDQPDIKFDYDQRTWVRP